MDYEAIVLAVEAGVATITLNRPEKLNAFNAQMTKETIDALKRTGRDKAVRCVVITGAGRGFSAGQDLGDVSSREDEFAISDHLRAGYNRIVTQITTMEKPVVAGVNGVAAGAGCGIALACDLRICSDKASFIQAFSRVGLLPDSGTTWTLTRLIGYARAYEMAVTADKVSAEKALSWGMVNEVVPHEQLPEILMAWAQQLATGPTVAYALTKRAMYKAMNSTLAEALEYEAQLQDIAGKTFDNKEGVTAFLEKREPEFRGE